MQFVTERQPWRWTVEFDVAPQFDDTLDLIAIWRAARQGGLPRRQDINARALGPFLKNVFTVVFDPKAGDYIYRTIGAAIVSAFGIDSFRVPVSSVYADPQDAAGARTLYKYVLRRRRPMVAAGHVQGLGGAWATFEAVHLPLREPEVGGMILGGLFFVDSVDDGQ